jgi:hypothetical protein
MGNDLTRLPWLFGLARATVHTIRFNLCWAFVYNIIGIGLALTGRLNPIVAALCMVASSVCVLTNSLRLRRFNMIPSLTPSTLNQRHGSLSGTAAGEHIVVANGSGSVAVAAEAVQ